MSPRMSDFFRKSPFVQPALFGCPVVIDGDTNANSQLELYTSQEADNGT